jgi:hypothetical protein
MPFSAETLLPVGPRNFGQSSPAFRVRKSVGSAVNAGAGITSIKEARKIRIENSLSDRMTAVFAGITLRWKVHFVSPEFRPMPGRGAFVRMILATDSVVIENGVSDATPGTACKRVSIEGGIPDGSRANW